MDYLRSFVIGSSFLVCVLFFFGVQNVAPNIKNYTYEDYTLVAPVYLGLMNAFSLYLAKKFSLSLRMRYIVIGIISPLIVISFARLSNSYNFTNDKWKTYYMKLIMKHFMIFNIIVYNLEKNI